MNFIVNSFKLNQPYYTYDYAKMHDHGISKVAAYHAVIQFDDIDVCIIIIITMH